MWIQESRACRLAAPWLLIGSLLLGAPLRNSSAEGNLVVALLTTDRVVQKMVTMNQQRAEALRSYTATRVYHLEYHGLKDKSADVVVKMTYQWPDRKEFIVVSESGSEMLRNPVLKRLLKAEVEAMQEENRQRTAIHPDNYEFRLAGYERTPRHEFYVLEATPKVKNKFLFHGQIWVDGRDFAIARIEGQPAKNPSWWTKRNDFQHSYTKWGDFWLPDRNETATQLRIVGRAWLTIEYKDYELTEVRSLQTPLAAEASVAGSIAEKK
jgi:outer membrane lipoprotein-sorting protein